MQVKVLYSFNNNSTVFLSRSKQIHSIKIAQIPMANGDSGEVLTLGAFDLKLCVLQVLKSSPENFKLQTEDYAVYYKDITEQPDEPFVANGVLSGLISGTKQHLIPGRVCQNLSANFLFGDKSNSSSHTLEIRLKLHTIEKYPEVQLQGNAQMDQNQKLSDKRHSELHSGQALAQKRSRSNKTAASSSSSSSSASDAAMKATRTKSLPIFYPQNQQIFNIINADKSNAPSKYDNKSVQDRFKLAPFLQAKILENPQRRYNSKIVSINNSNNKNMPNNSLNDSTNRYLSSTASNSSNEPLRAMRTRSMVTNKQMPMIISSPINEETDASDTDYQETNVQSENGIEDEEEEEEIDNENNSSPYTPQQPPYNPTKHNSIAQHSHSQHQQHPSSSGVQFQSLPDLEDLDSRKTHAIPLFRLPKNHSLLCMNSNCATTYSITWRYFETGYHPNYLSLHRAKDFDIKHYEGMIGPLCNACYLFLRNKGFMRPEAVVKKYMQQQRYKKELKQKDEQLNNSLQPKQYASSPPVFHKFTTPSHTPSAINQVIQNNMNNTNSNINVNSRTNSSNNNLNISNRATPNYLNFNDLNDFMNQLNSFGGPLTDIDPLPQGVTPPMMAEKSNTRIINLYDDEDGEDKENCPPPATSDDQHQYSDLDHHNKHEFDDFEKMMVKSFSHSSEKNSPSNNTNQTVWMNNLFGDSTPRDHITPKDGTNNNSVSNQESAGNFNTFVAISDVKDGSSEETESEVDSIEKSPPHPNLPQLRTFTTGKSSSPLMQQRLQMTLSNMPSSPMLTHASDAVEEGDLHGIDNNVVVNSSSPTSKATRVNTTTLVMSNYNSKGELGELEGDQVGSTPPSDFFSNEDAKGSTNMSQYMAQKKNIH